MKTKDRLKEEIGLDKLIMTIASAILSSLIAWIFNNKDLGLSSSGNLLVILIAIVFLMLVIFLFFNINTKIRNL